MDSFLDTAVIIKYIESDYIKEELRKRCFNYVESSKLKILISSLVREELKRAVIKRKELYDNIIKKIKTPQYEINHANTKFLNKGDIIFANNLYLKLKEKNVLRLKENFDSEINFLNAAVTIFLKNKVQEIILKNSEIYPILISVLHEFIKDYADCLVLASAIQIQQNMEQFLFVTADKHFDEGSYDFIKGDIRLEKYKKPILKNLLFEN